MEYGHTSNSYCKYDAMRRIADSMKNMMLIIKHSLFSIHSMLVAWVLPSRVFSSERREQLLLWLDALGKYSLVDANILVIMMVAFSMKFNLGEMSSMEIFVIPKVRKMRCEYFFFPFFLKTYTWFISTTVWLLQFSLGDYLITRVGSLCSFHASPNVTKTKLAPWGYKRVIKNA